jgi:hypothetical protein
MEAPPEQLINLNVCGGCQCLDKAMRHCNRCKTMFYCSHRCQKRHWEAERHPHKGECVKFDAAANPKIYYVKAQYRLIPAEGFPVEEAQDAIDAHIVGQIDRSRYVTHSYRFVARGQVCGGWLLGELHSDNPAHLFSKAVLAGRWIFCIGPNRAPNARACEYQIGAFISRLQADFVVVDAPVNSDAGLAPVQILLDWMIAVIGPLVGLKPPEGGERPGEWMASNLREIVLFDFIYRPGPRPVVTEEEMAVEEKVVQNAE